MRIVLAPRFSRQYALLTAADRQLCDAAVEALPDAFGHLHRRTGLGVRALRRGVNECRASRAVRIGFTRHGDILLLHVVGSHDAVRTWLRGNL